MNLEKEYLDWFHSHFSRFASSADFFSETIAFFNQSGLEIQRANWGTKTLHPQVETINQLWFPEATEKLLQLLPKVNNYSRRKISVPYGDIVEARWSIGNIETGLFKNSPIALALGQRSTYRFHYPSEKEKGISTGNYPFPVLADLERLRVTDYMVIPIHFANGDFVYESFSSSKPGGFSEEEVRSIHSLAPVLANFWERFIQRELR